MIPTIPAMMMIISRVSLICGLSGSSGDGEGEGGTTTGDDVCMDGSMVVTMVTVDEIKEGPVKWYECHYMVLCICDWYMYHL